MKGLIRFGLLVLCALVGLPASFAQGQGAQPDRMNAPREARSVSAPMPTAQGGSPLSGAMRFFRTTISPVDGDRCAMYPTCSQYGEQALRRHGSAIGLLMIVDRLFHEWSEMAIAPQVTVHGVRRFWDPMEANDFWFVKGSALNNRGRQGGP